MLPISIPGSTTLEIPVQFEFVHRRWVTDVRFQTDFLAEARGAQDPGETAPNSAREPLALVSVHTQIFPGVQSFQSATPRDVAAAALTVPAVWVVLADARTAGVISPVLASVTWLPCGAVRSRSSCA